MVKRKSRDLSKYKKDTNKIEKVKQIDYPELPAYIPVIENKHKGIRFFFEPALNPEQANTRYHSEFKKFIGPGEHCYNNKKHSFYLHAKTLLGERTAKTLARMVIKHVENPIKWTNTPRLNSVLFLFVDFLAINKINQLEMLTQQDVFDFGRYLANTCNHKTDNSFTLLKSFLKTLNLFKKLNIDDVKWKGKEISPHAIDLDVHLESSYSDKVVIQILAYVLYEIENIKSSINHISTLTSESLGENYLAPDMFEKTVKPREFFYDNLISKLLRDKTEGFEILRRNILYALNGNDSYKGRLTAQIQRTAKKLNLMTEYSELQCFIRKKPFTERWAEASFITKESLGDSYFESDNFAIKVNDSVKFYDEKIKSFLLSDAEGFEILRDNVLLYIKGNPKRPDWLMQRIKQVSTKYSLESEYTSFLLYLRKEMWSIRAGEYEINKHNHQYYKYLSGQTDHLAFLIGIYECITCGVNREVILNTLAYIDGVSTLENYDKFFGADGETKQSEKSILLIGKKNRSKINGLSKDIVVSIPTSSPFYNYLKLLDSTKLSNREYFYEISSDTWYSYSKLFVQLFPIYDDDNIRITSLESSKFRKAFAGHKLIKLLENVQSENELVERLADSLNHNSFDTTVFSYLFKSGMSNHVLDLAITTLTNDLLEKSLKFAGTIATEEPKEKSDKQTPRLICECLDPYRPTHNIPINTQYCKRFDLCLGCERAEVYEQHIPRIVYKILQYEEVMETNIDMYNISLADKHAIALDTLRQFADNHPKGREIVDDGYQYANKCWLEGKQLLPKILRVGGL